jgi:mannitol/fructose-specific phosphotransferase system IIA component (Ntr-type)
LERLIEACDQKLVMLDVPARSLDAAVREMVDQLAEKGAINSEHIDEIIAALDEQGVTSTAIGDSVAVPHCYLDIIEKPLIAIARLDRGINANAPDGVPVRFIFLLIGPKGATAEHLDSLAGIARLTADDEFRYQALAAKSIDEFRRAIEERKSGQPAAEHFAAVGEGLRYTGKPFGGFVADVRRRAKYYISDYVDGFYSKCLGSTFFLFFACLAPAIIFGGLMYGKTGGNIGVVEMIVATCFCGLAYAIFAGQPMIILGGTGPMLIFTGILYQYCQRYDIGHLFLPAYAWVGIWTGLILLILAATDASCLMRYFTRFTDEIFAALISVIFIYEAIEKLLHIFVDAQTNPDVGYDVAMFSLLLALGTYYIAASLSSFRKSHLLVHNAREFFADFGPTIAIISMAAVAFIWRDSVKLEPLDAPDTFGTSNGRPWFIPFLQAPLWLIGITILPALLCTVLVFLDQNITARLVNSPDNNLQKGEAYHLDLFVVGVLIGICSLFGLPWLVAATVRSLNHVRSLATTEEIIDKSGRQHTHILHVRENRITGISIHLLIGLSLLLLPFLKYIPLAVLFGLFLYMGVVSMKGNQFFERLSLWATDPSMYPSSHYVRRVPRIVMHLFTVVQLVCLVVLWVVKTSAFGILFPLFIAILVPIRFCLNRFIEPKYLADLDAEEIPEEEEDAWN